MADHYRLQHVAESGHVVLFRSPYARMYSSLHLSLIYSPETRLSELSKTVRTSGSSASSTIGAEDGAPTIPTPEIRQIMKRVPGKSGRDGEDDAKSESSQSQVLSHEERQAKYEQTRARIFSDYVASQGSEAAEKGSDGDGGSESIPPSYQ
jgi:SUZ domain